MRDHKNGWPIIAEHLRRHDLCQSDLARLLGISPSAVTQLKQESYLLNFRQLARMADALQMQEQEHFALYRMIFRARQEGIVIPRALPQILPELSAEELTAYCPALEPLADFLCRRTGVEKTEFLRVILADDEPFAGAVIRVDRYPRQGDAVLVMFADGTPGVRRLRLEEDTVILLDERRGKPPVSCSRGGINRHIFWMYPVEKIIPATDPGEDLRENG